MNPWMRAVVAVLVATVVGPSGVRLVAQQPAQAEPMQTEPTQTGPAQTGPAATAAEVAFREAWWAESGKGDLAAAVAGYLAAVAASGPEAVRARALLAAGAAQQRLGRVDAAIASFRQLVRDFAGQRDSVAQARAHLDELLAVDLRDSFDEWYDRRLFSESMQNDLIQAIHELADLRAQIQRGGKTQHEAQQRFVALRRLVRGYGKAALPALRRECESGDHGIAAIAIDLLFEFGEMPPVAVLLRSGDWADDADAWCVVLHHPGPVVEPGKPVPTMRGRLLRAALRGVPKLVEELSLVEVQDDDTGPIRAATLAMLRGEAEERARVLEAILGDKVPLRLRLAMESAVADGESLPLAAREWQTLLDGVQRFGTRLRCVREMARHLRRGDEGLVDRLLDCVEQVPENGRVDMFDALAGGLQGNLAASDLDWTPARLRRLLVAGAAGDGSQLTSLLTDQRRSDRAGGALAAAVFAAEGLAALVRAYGFTCASGENNGSDGTALAAAFAIDSDDERDGALLAQRWHRAIVANLDGAWDRWDQEQRLAALCLINQVAGAWGRSTLVEWLAPRVGEEGPVHERFEALRERFQ